MTSFWPNIGQRNYDDENTSTDTGYEANESDSYQDENGYQEEPQAEPEQTEAISEEPNEDSYAGTDSTSAEDHASPDDEPTDDRPTKEKDKPKKRGIPRVEAATVRKIVAAYRVVETEKGGKMARALLGVGATEPSNLVAQLSETRNRRHVDDVAKAVRQIADCDADERMMNLAWAFGDDKTLAKTMFSILDAACDDGRFGRSSGDPRRDARQIATAWGDGVDLSVINDLNFN